MSRRRFQFGIKHLLLLVLLTGLAIPLVRSSFWRQTSRKLVRVSVPDGGKVIIGGTISHPANNLPLLSTVPKPPTSVTGPMITVTPRIIIQDEEEEILIIPRESSDQQ